MDGPISQAKSQLWKIVNEFNHARVRDEIPEIEVALYEYGNNSVSATDNCVRQVLPLTRDLDRVSDELFKLRTNGGEEYCGVVIREAIRHLGWDTGNNNLKLIFIAGNEPFDQGPVRPIEAYRDAHGRGIVVSTIYCGPRSQGIAEYWDRGPLAADGKFLVIDQN